MPIQALSSSRSSSPRSTASLSLVAEGAPRLSPRSVDGFEPMATAAQATTAAVTLKRGDKSAAVKTWQTQLVSLGYLLQKDVKGGDGTFGPKTEAATRQFQHDHGLPETGRLDAATQPKAKLALTKLTALAGTTLERGQQSEAVRVWQTKLVRAGFLTQGQMDSGAGLFGPQTQAATVAFQQANGLNVSGRVGVATQAKMTKVIEAGPSSPPPPTGQVEVRNISQLYSVGSEDDWNRFSNCAPASVAMIAKALGFHKTDWSDGKLVNWLGGQGGVGANGAGWPQVQTMAQSAGLKVSAPMYGQDLDWVRAQLKAGKLVAANGNRGVTLAHSSYTDGVSGGHWIVIKGVDSAGNFLVEDPSTDCKKLSPAELQRYFYSRDGGGVALAIGK